MSELSLSEIYNCENCKNCYEYYQENQIYENCAKCGKLINPIIKEDFGMLPSFTYKTVPVYTKKILRRDKNGRLRVVTAEFAIPFPAAFQVAARIPNINLKSCNKKWPNIH